MARAKTAPKRQRGSIDELPSGALRVRVYAGIDPVSKKRHYLTDVVPPGPKAEKEAEKARTRLLNELDEQRNPRTNSTVGQLIERHLAMSDAEETTLRTYRGYVKNHVLPFLGELKVGAVDAHVLDSFYADLRRCRIHCNGKKRTDHRTDRKHDCDHRCGPHKCSPLGSSTVRQIHFILSGAFKRAVRWRWVSANPISQAEPPAAPKPDPKPPTASEAARILNEAWRDPDWGSLVWLAMTTGARRGELCALRWRDVQLDKAVLTYRRSIAQDGGETWEKDTKDHQKRRVALDPDTVAVLIEHHDRCGTRATALDVELSADSFVFSGSPDNRTYLLPDSVTQRYGNLTDRLGIDSSLHKLRHYSATELITAGVDVRTVAGRLGHSGGGTTTLRVYSAWVSESDQRAATSLFARMPARPEPVDAAERAKTEPRSPYEKLAAQLRAEILAGDWPDGSTLPTLVELAAEHHIAVGTAQRTISLLRTWGLVDVVQGRRATVIRPGEQQSD